MKINTVTNITTGQVFQLGNKFLENDSPILTTFNIVNVKKNPSTNEFLTIEDALNSITTNTATNPFLISIGPGVYVENTLEMKPYVSLHGSGQDITIIENSATNQHQIIGNSNSFISNVTLQGTTDTGFSAIYMDKTGLQSSDIFQVIDCRFNDNYHFVFCDSTSDFNVIQVTNCVCGNVNATNAFYSKGNGTGISKILLRGSNFFVPTVSDIVDFCKSDGLGCEIVVNAVTFFSPSTTGTCFNVTNGSKLRLTSTNISGFETTIDINTNTGNYLAASGVNIENSTNHLVVTDNTSTGFYQGIIDSTKTSIDALSSIYIVNKNKKVVTVSKNGGEYSTIEAALNSITDSSASNTYLVDIEPGIYIENELFVPDFVNIKGDSISSVTVKPAGNHNIFNIGNSCEIAFLKIEEVPSGFFGLSFVNSGNYCVVHKLSGYNSIGGYLKVDSSTTDSYIYLEYVDFNGTYETCCEVSSSLGFISNVNLENFYIFDGDGTNAFNITGENTTVSLLAGGISAISGDGFYIQDGGTLDIDTFKINGFVNGIINPNVGVGSFITIRSTLFENNTKDFYLSNLTTTATFSGTADYTKFDIDPSIAFNCNFTDFTNNGAVTVGTLYYGDTVNNIFDFSTYLLDTGTMGLFQGGVITLDVDLDISISSGFGYVEKTGNITTRINWTGSTLTLNANEAVYVFINENGVLSTNINYPDNKSNIILGRVVTNDTTVEVISDVNLIAHHTGNYFDNLNRDGLGSIYSSGSVVTENATPLKIDITSGVYFFSTRRFVPSGGTAVTFISFYQDGLGGWVKSSTDLLDNTSYDDGLGTLATLSTNYYVKHSLYVSGDGANEIYFLVYGQSQYISLIDAETGTIANAPSYFSDGITLIATIICQESNPNIVEIIDSRPIIGFRSPSVSGVTFHGNLLGLGSNDHPQYLLRDGTNVMNGNLNLNTNNITNVTLINGIDILSHASRHVPNGADPLPVGTPVDIGTANSNGINNTFSRSDHVHAHGTHSVGTNHAAVTNTTNGFMSFTDKIKLDSISSNASVSSVGLLLPNIFSISNSPVTSSGTLTGTFVNQLQNLVFASPNGSTGVPSFRSLVENDIPALSQSKITNLVTDLSNKQPIDATLTALSSFNSNGLLVQTALDTFTSRTITPNSTKISITNGNGVAGNPTIDVSESNLTLDNIGGTLSISKGGTGQTSKTLSFDALSPTSTKGDIITNNGTNNIRLGVGSNNQALVADSTTASGLKWATVTATIEKDLQSATAAINQATSSSTLVDVPGLSITAVNSSSLTYTISFSGVYTNNSATLRTFTFAIIINGVAVETRTLSQSTTNRTQVHLQYQGAVSNGQVIKIQFATSTGTLTLAHSNLTVVGL